MKIELKCEGDGWVAIATLAEVVIAIGTGLTARDALDAINVELDRAEKRLKRFQAFVNVIQYRTFADPMTAATFEEADYDELG